MKSYTIRNTLLELKKTNSYLPATGDTRELLIRLQQLSAQELNNIPAYLRKNLLRYLRANY